MKEKLTRTAAIMAANAMFGSMQMEDLMDNKSVHNSPEPRQVNPWDTVTIPKSVRKGKTYAEIQQLRIEEYKKTHPGFSAAVISLKDDHAERP